MTVTQPMIYAPSRPTNGHLWSDKPLISAAPSTNSTASYRLQPQALL